MSSRPQVAFVLALFVASSGYAKGKKPLLPDYVLRAHTVMVVVNPGSEVPLMSPGENKRAQDDVEKAILKWGRFTLAQDSQSADLVVSIRCGRVISPTISGGPTADRPVVLQQPGDGQVRAGVEVGRRPDVADPGPSGAQNDGPHTGTEIGPADDLMQVFPGKTQYPLDAAPVWSYSGHDALQPPTVPAVRQFRKAIEEAEKQQKSKP